ncbi:MAG TPA: efflux RND transporter periplasmic adaptor subunit [Flavobacteriaceae bacterium]|nr:efflux RND transporter periplasmic adaptor subunit [Flavobacteriaceae bacterium]
MKRPYRTTIAAFLLAIPVGLVSCGNNEENKDHEEEATTHGDHEESSNEDHGEEVMLSSERFQEMQMKIGTLSTKQLSTFVEANGKLEVPPQNRATITAAYGANFDEILVIEGDQVRKGETVGYISHPELVKMQTNFVEAHNRLGLLKNEFNRQKKLYEAGVTSGMEFQQAESNFQIAQSLVSSLKTQLKMLGANPQQIISGNIYERFPLRSPIDGAVQEIHVVTGQYVQPQTDLFEIVNTHHVHVDLMVFEEDVLELETGQIVYFETNAVPEKTFVAKIISIGKSFEEGPKAVHVHAEITDETERYNLIPGMYVSARIATEKAPAQVLPEDAIVQEEGKWFVFAAAREGESWSFTPVEVNPGRKEGNWVEINFIEPQKAETKFAYNNVYYLMAEMKKGEGGGHHHH